MPDATSKSNETVTPADVLGDSLAILGNLFTASQTYLNGISRYTASFYVPYLLAAQYFQQVEARRCAGKTT